MHHTAATDQLCRRNINTAKESHIADSAPSNHHRQTFSGRFRQYMWYPWSHASHSSNWSALPPRRHTRQRARSTDRDQATDESRTDRWTATRDTLHGWCISDECQWWSFLLPASVIHIAMTQVIYMAHTHTHNHFTALPEYVWDHPGEQAPER